MGEFKIELIIELLRESLEAKKWEKVEEAIELLTTLDVSNPFDGYEKDEDIEEEDLW
jgi:hypothetical protein